MTDPTPLIDETAVEEVFIKSGGPGGQNVNKVATAVQLRFDVNRAQLPKAVKDRLLKLAGSRSTKDGVIVIEVSTHRTQDRNRATARTRLEGLIKLASQAPKRRIPTKPSLSARRKRVDEKKKRAALKKQRTRVVLD
ncbi:MAG: alternative ribosome rescue aminoacyl-tRNA hydrolase ArfB [Pseudomonadota bacterium]